MSGGNKGSKSTSTSTPHQQAQYNRLLGAADKWLNTGGFDPVYAGGMDTVADLTPEQQAALGSKAALGGELGSIYGTGGVESLQNFLGGYDPSKTGLSAAIDAANQRLDWNYGTTVAPTIRQGATGAGQYGSTRHGVAEGIAQANLGTAKANAAADLAYRDQQAFNQNQLSALQNLSAISKGLGSGTDMQYNAGALQQKQNQLEIQGQLDKWAYENNVDLNTLLAYKQLVSGDMGGVTTSKTSGGGGGGFGSALGAIGGAALGGMFGGVGGASFGSSLGGQVGGLLG